MSKSAQIGARKFPNFAINKFSNSYRYLKDHDYSTSIIKGDQFNKTMKAFNSKAKDLKMKGMGNKPKAAAPASDSEINMLYERGQLGDATPASIINTLWLNNTLHFGMRGGGAEHR